MRPADWMSAGVECVCPWSFDSASISHLEATQLLDAVHDRGLAASETESTYCGINTRI